MNRLLHNWVLKLTALVLAVALWSHVRGEVNPLETTTFAVKCSAALPQNWQLATPDAVPDVVRVTIRAPRLKLREIKGGMPLNPLASPDEAPLLSVRYLKARIDFSALKALDAQAAPPESFPVKIENDVEDSEVLGIKPPEIKLSVARAAN